MGRQASTVQCDATIGPAQSATMSCGVLGEVRMYAIYICPLDSRTLKLSYMKPSPSTVHYTHSILHFRYHQQPHTKGATSASSGQRESSTANRAREPWNDSGRRDDSPRVSAQPFLEATIQGRPYCIKTKKALVSEGCKHHATSVTCLRVTSPRCFKVEAQHLRPLVSIINACLRGRERER